jgi:hypothetical protein
MLSRVASTAAAAAARRRSGFSLVAKANCRRCFSAAASSPTGRVPLPPMPRVAPHINTTASASTANKSRLRQMWENGNLLIGFGWTLFGVLLVDRYLQYTEGMSVEGAIGMVEETARQKRFEILELHRNDPTIFHCIVRKVYTMQGSHSLMHVDRDDTVDVLEEGIGPDNLYNLCRKMQTTPDGEQQVVSIGWYPVQYLEKVVVPPNKQAWWFSKLAFWK